MDELKKTLLKMKRLTWIFIALFMVGTPAFSQKKEVAKVKTIVIDPGHGGVKPGAQGAKIQEKDLTLAVALKFGKLIADNYPDVNIIYTRTTDVDVALSERAHIANRAKADLFVSVHANSHPTHQPTGVETFVMGLSQSKSNMEVAKKENADILLESNYENNSDYNGFDPNSPESNVQFAMFQNAYLDRSLNFAGFIQKEYSRNIKTLNRGVKQAELFVLYKTTCPAVLTEIGFISNPTEEAYMMSDIGQGTLAECLLKAFAEYKAQIEGTQVPAKFKIDLPGYGKNAPSKAEQLAEAKRVADDIAAEEKEEQQRHIADSVAKVQADSIAAIRAAAAKQNAEATKGKKKKHVKEQAPVTQEDSTETQASQTAAAEKKNGITYRVQFLVSPKRLDDGNKAFKGVEGYDMYEQDGTYRYTMGDEPTTTAATRIQYELRKKGFKDAFIIAFYNGKRISIQQAREMEEN
jgi:N-acetylmuramoyl-L-alanine amidase